MRARTGRFLFRLYMQMFSTGTGYIDVIGSFLSYNSERGIKQVIPKLFPLVKIVNKTTIPNSIFRFNSNFFTFYKFSYFVKSKTRMF